MPCVLGVYARIYHIDIPSVLYNSAIRAKQERLEEKERKKKDEFKAKVVWVAGVVYQFYY